MTEPKGEEWRDISTAPKDGRTIEAWFPLDGLSEYWDRKVRVWWRDDEYAKGWIWEERAVRGYSDCYQPSHWCPVDNTTAEDEQAKIYRPPRFPARPRPRRTGETIAAYYERIGLRKSWSRTTRNA